MSISMTQAAEILGVSRQRVHQMIQHGHFAQVEYFGPMIVLQQEEVEKVRAMRAAVVAEMAKSGSTIFAAQSVVSKRERRALLKANREAKKNRDPS